jgi:hypothetical protein
MALVDSLVAPVAALAGVFITMVYTGRQARFADARSQRDTRRARLAEDYAVMLRAAVGTSDLLRQIQAAGMQFNSQNRYHWAQQLQQITTGLTDAQIALMTEETEPEVTTVLEAGYRIAKAWANIDPVGADAIDPAVLKKTVEDAHAITRPLTELMREAIRAHLARLNEPIPRRWRQRLRGRSKL